MQVLQMVLGKTMTKKVGALLPSVIALQRWLGGLFFQQL
jgi:hypothetical protein